MTPRRRSRLLRPAGFDELGLRRALGERVVPFLVAAMAFLASLSLGGAVGASALAGRWRGGATASATVQVPDPRGRSAEGAASTRAEAERAALRATAGVAYARALSDEELTELLRPWIGGGVQDVALPLPAVIDVGMAAGAALAPVAARVGAVAPGALMEGHALWTGRLTALADSLLACATLAVAVVAAVAAAVIAAATRAGLAARRASIEIVHALGASDGYIAGRFASRAMRLATAGGAAGALLALPVLVGMAGLAAPLAGGAEPPAQGTLAALPPALWLTAPGLPLAAGAIGWVTAQVTVRRWLRRLA